jgi:putative Mg2+ transporter-C (MgtC) family protein
MVLSVLLGGVVGAERRRVAKPAGLRTMALVCLGACVFTQAGILLAGDDKDPARVAAQVVTGVGFLGAGAIIRERGLVIGVTTAAAIWTVASIGVLLGTGYAAAGLFVTILTVATLAATRRLEMLLIGPCIWKTVRVEYAADGGKTRPRIEEVLDDFEVPDEQVAHQPEAGDASAVVIRYCDRHRYHRTFLAVLAALPEVRAIRDIGHGAGAG